MAEAYECSYRLLPLELQAEANEMAIKINPANAYAIDKGSRIHRGFDELALPVGKTWNSGRRITIRFLGGNRDSDVKRRTVFQYANEWAQYANLSFIVVDAGDADIRVNIDDSGQFWSQVGTDSRMQQDQPSLNLGWQDEEPSDDDYKRKILHEFGHALGCIHEHESPNANINWNKPAVYEYFERNHGWDHDKVDQNMFTVYDRMTTHYETFDVNSIMIYPIRSSWTTDGFSTNLNTDLSDGDKSFIRVMYPGRGIPEGTGKSNAVDVNFFSTTEVRPWDKGGQTASKKVNFSLSYIKPPAIAVGLNCINTGVYQNCRVNSYADDIHSDGFTIHLDTWSNTRLYEASCSWFKCSYDDPNFRVGSVSVGENGGHERVNFGRPSPFDVPPTVIVWIRMLDTNYHHNIRLKAYADDVYTDGCTIYVETWSKTVLNAAEVSWIAYQEDMKSVASGTYGTGGQDWHDPLQGYAGTVSFPTDTFDYIPKTVLIGLNTIDLDSNYDPRIRTFTSNVTKDKMDWTLETWADGIMYEASVSYLVM